MAPEAVAASALSMLFLFALGTLPMSISQLCVGGANCCQAILLTRIRAARIESPLKRPSGGAHGRH